MNIDEIVSVLLKKKNQEKKQILLATTEASIKKHIVYGIVLKPDIPDAHDDIISTEEIERTAHNFMLNYQHIGEQHREFANAALVESYCAPVAFKFGEKEVPKGSWVMAVKIYDPVIWGKIEAGLITGFSTGGLAYVEPDKKS